MPSTLASTIILSPANSLTSTLASTESYVVFTSDMPISCGLIPRVSSEVERFSVRYSATFGGRPILKPAKSSDKSSSDRSEEHTSELQSRFDLVCRLLLEKKKQKKNKTIKD